MRVRGLRFVPYLRNSPKMEGFFLRGFGAFGTIMPGPGAQTFKTKYKHPESDKKLCCFQHPEWPHIPMLTTVACFGNSGEHDWAGL